MTPVEGQSSVATDSAVGAVWPARQCLGWRVGVDAGNLRTAVNAFKKALKPLRRQIGHGVAQALLPTIRDLRQLLLFEAALYQASVVEQQHDVDREVHVGGADAGGVEGQAAD